MDIKALLLQAQAERGLSKPKMARLLGVNTGLYYRWLSDDPIDHATPSPESCRRIAAGLGLDLDYVLEVAGHREASTDQQDARARVSARQRAIQEQVAAWVAAVGPEHEELLWQHLKAQGESAVALIQRLGPTPLAADNTNAPAADNTPITPRSGGPRKISNRDQETGDDHITSDSPPALLAA